MYRTRLLAALAGALLATAASAADVYTLTPAQKDAALAAGASAGMADDAALAGAGGPLAVHGEMGAAIGTNGYRSIYGTAAVPIGTSGGAIVSFENSRIGDPRRR